jgi:hypothetical protein
VSWEILVQVSSEDLKVGGFEVGAEAERAVADDLATRLALGPLSVADALLLARRLASEVASLHARGEAHARIGPRRVVLPEGVLARARLVSPVDRGAGEPGYYSPEQARGEPAGSSSDVFALGALLFACLTGRAVFEGTQVTAVLARVLLEDAPRVSMVRNDVSEALDTLVARMLSKRPIDRPRDAAELAFELAVLDPTEVDQGMSEQTVPETVAERERARLYVVLAAPGGAFAGTSGDLGARLEAAVAPLGARVTMLVDGAALALLTGRGISADQSVKAARTALAMRAVLPGAAVAVVTGAGVRVAEVPLGEMVERAARMLAATSSAPAIVIDEDLAGLLDARFVIGGDARGLLLLSEADPGPASRLLGDDASPFVGHEREIGALEAMFRAAADEEIGSAAVITGVHGSGKALLVRELIDRIERRGEPFSLCFARSHPGRAGAPFALVADLLRTLARVNADDSPETQLAKLRGRVRRHVGPRHAARVSEQLAGLAVPPEAGSGAASLDEGSEAAQALDDFFSTECDARPTLVVIEDLHAADPASVELLGDLVAGLTERRFLLVAIARPEVHARFPDLWPRARPTVIPLIPPEGTGAILP